MRKFILAIVFVLLSATSINTNAAESPFAEQELLLTLLLGAGGVDGKVAYKIGVPDDYGKPSNMWLVVITDSNESDMDTLANALAQAIAVDASIPNKTDYVTVLQNGMMYIAPMPEVRSCIKGVGIAGFECAKKHIRAGKV